ncbi:anthranilate synthase component II [Paludibacterium paludis]|uniref:Glutamine amidotransferase domain-containing protein n=1 Tax=Paludibacterium paludis TaxID=1225769 RepID=A0A918P206_9NEIS|nr:aminodeoxychorismate/anthranilate synthase component II [Paludibacterium paludis]GGY14655.1 hypothetical protein GCM10011289_17490 [Paludibacterium paludis]
MKLLIIDNYDSFTYNLFNLIYQAVGIKADVLANNAAGYEAIAGRYDGIVISPGPGHPANHRDFGLSRDAIALSSVPVLGVCLGHQGIAHHFGGVIRHAPEPVHGLTDRIHHTGQGLFHGIPDGFSAVRYHSLMVASPLPDCLEATAWNAQGLIMALRHRSRPLVGVQFHPESICSEHGPALIQNFARML